MNINRCLFTGGTKWPSLPPVGQTGHHQRATRVSSSCVKTGQFVTCVSVTTLWPCVVCVCVCVSGFRRTRRGQRRATATCWSFSGITCFTRWQKLGRPGSTSATSSPASTKSVNFLPFFPFIDLFDEHTEIWVVLCNEVKHAKWHIFRTSVHASFPLVKETCMHLPADCRRGRAEVGLLSACFHQWHLVFGYQLVVSRSSGKDLAAHLN